MRRRNDAGGKVEYAAQELRNNRKFTITLTRTKDENN